MGQGWGDFGVNEQWPNLSIVVMDKFFYESTKRPLEIYRMKTLLCSSRFIDIYLLSYVPVLLDSAMKPSSVSAGERDIIILSDNWNHRDKGTILVAYQHQTVMTIWEQILSIQRSLCKDIWPQDLQLDASSPPAVCSETKFTSIVREYHMCACKFSIVNIWLCPCLITGQTPYLNHHCYNDWKLMKFCAWYYYIIHIEKMTDLERCFAR